jgi:hypothetical protein
MFIDNNSLLMRVNVASRAVACRLAPAVCALTLVPLRLSGIHGTILSTLADTSNSPLCESRAGASGGAAASPSHSRHCPSPTHLKS